MTLEDLRFALSSSNVVGQAGSLLSNNVEIPVQAGTYLSSAADVAGMVVGLFEGRPVYLSDIAEVSIRSGYAGRVHMVCDRPGRR